MSLDIYFDNQEYITCECGKKHVVSLGEVYWKNITHNLGNMADKAGIYQCLWHPEEIPINVVSEIILLLEKGIKAMKEKPEYYKQFDAENGWGTYEQFVPWLEELLEACKQYPNATVRVSI